MRKGSRRTDEGPCAPVRWGTDQKYWGDQMVEMTASAEHIRWCADEFTRAADGVGAVAGADTAAAVAALAPVFGVFGGGFLEAFAAAHASHAAGTARLARVLDAAGATAAATAVAYERHEDARSSALAGEGAAL